MSCPASLPPASVSPPLLHPSPTSPSQSCPASCSIVPAARPPYHSFFPLRSGAHYSLFLFPLLADFFPWGTAPEGRERPQDLLLCPSRLWVPRRVSPGGVGAPLPRGCPCATVGSPVWSDVSYLPWRPSEGRRGWRLGTPISETHSPISPGRVSLKPEVPAQGREGGRRDPQGLRWACLTDIMADPSSRLPLRCRPLFTCASSPLLA